MSAEFPRARAERRLASFGAALLSIATSTLAWSAPIEDPETGLRVETDVAGARTCVIVPVSARDPAACDGLDLAQLEATARAPAQLSLVLFEVVRDGAAVVVVHAFAQRPGPVAHEDITAFLRGVRSKLPAGADREPAYELRTVRDIQGFRSEPMDAANGARVHVLGFVRARKSVAVSVVVGSGAQALGDRVDAAIDSSITLPGEPVVELGEPRKGQVAYLFGVLTGKVLVLAAVAAVIGAVLWRDRARRKAAAGTRSDA